MWALEVSLAGDIGSPLSVAWQWLWLYLFRLDLECTGDG